MVELDTYPDHLASVCTLSHYPDAYLNIQNNNNNFNDSFNVLKDIDTLEKVLTIK